MGFNASGSLHRRARHHVTRHHVTRYRATDHFSNVRGRSRLRRPADRHPSTGAWPPLTRAVEAEVAAWIADHAHVTDERGRRRVGPGRDGTDKHSVSIGAEGAHFNVRWEEDRTCILVLMGATPDGGKEWIAARNGDRESESSWKGPLLDVKQHGLTVSGS